MNNLVFKIHRIVYYITSWNDTIIYITQSIIYACWKTPWEGCRDF